MDEFSFREKLRDALWHAAEAIENDGNKGKQAHMMHGLEFAFDSEFKAQRDGILYYSNGHGWRVRKNPYWKEVYVARFEITPSNTTIWDHNFRPDWSPELPKGEIAGKPYIAECHGKRWLFYQSHNLPSRYPAPMPKWQLYFWHGTDWLPVSSSLTMWVTGSWRLSYAHRSIVYALRLHEEESEE
jgi:hypothetical protein